MKPSRVFLACALPVLLPLCALAATDAAGARGGGAASRVKSGASACMVPINAEMYRADLPDGKVRVFLQTGPTELTEVPDGKWFGIANGDRLVAMTGQEKYGNRRGYVFEKGRLTLSVDTRGREHAYDGSFAPPGPLAALWPADALSAEDRDRYDIWKGDARLRFGAHGNPNTAAALFVELALAAFALLFCRRRLPVLAGAVLFAGASFAVVLTYSRSGFLALAAGTAVMLAFRLKALLRSKTILVIAALIALLGAAVVAKGAGDRFTHGMYADDDESNANRLVLWRSAPQMVWTAPDGWGLGKGGTAYNDWFEPYGRMHPVASLFNTHLTWLVEFGWPARAAYVFGWALVLWLCAACAARRGQALPLAMWVAFGVAMTFNHIGRICWLWALPVLSLAPVLLAVRRGAARTWLFGCALSALCAAAALACLCVAGSRQDAAAPSVARHAGGRVLINGDEPSVWIVNDGFVLDGDYKGFFGKELRRWCRVRREGRAPCVGLVDAPSALPADATAALVVGRACSELVRAAGADARLLPRLRSVVMLSPDIPASELPEEFVGRFGVRVVQGEFAALRTPDFAKPPVWLTVVPGAETYIPGWTSYLEALAEGAREGGGPKHGSGHEGG